MNMKGNRIVAGMDGSDQSLRAVEWAAREAARHGAALRIVSVPVLPPRMSWSREVRGTPDTVADEIYESSKKALVAAAARAAEVEPGLEVDTALLSGPPAQALTDAAADAAMLVVGSRGAGGFAALVLGSVSRYVATQATGPVVVVREETTAVQHEIVVGIRDLDQPTAIGFAFEEAELRRARLRAVHAWHWFLPEMRLTGTERPGADAREVTAEAAGWLAGLLGALAAEVPGRGGGRGCRARCARAGAGRGLGPRRPGRSRPEQRRRLGSPEHGRGHARGPASRARPGRGHP